MSNSTITTEWYSEAIGRPTKVNIIIPPSLIKGEANKDRRYKALYILPGALSSSDALFNEMDLVSEYDGIIPENVIIFAVTPTFSYYCDYKDDYRYANKYFRYITTELIDITRTLFPISNRREDTGIYGFSMGGFGAFYCGLNRPDIYGYVGSQSGMLDVQWAIDERPFMKKKHERQFGNITDITGTEYDLYGLLEKLNTSAENGNVSVPKIFQSWGQEKDYLNAPNKHMYEHMKKMKNLDYVCYPLDCRHSWGKHNEGVNLFLKWFLSEGKEERECRDFV